MIDAIFEKIKFLLKGSMRTMDTEGDRLHFQQLHRFRHLSLFYTIAISEFSLGHWSRICKDAHGPDRMARYNNFNQIVHVGRKTNFSCWWGFDLTFVDPHRLSVCQYFAIPNSIRIP